MFKYLVTLALGISSAIFPAASLTHLYCAERWLEHHDVENREAFIAGTLYPDIRYLIKIPREQTHKRNINIKDIMEAPTDFQKGVVLHWYVDEQGEIYDTAGGLSHLKALALGCVADDRVMLFLKFLSDEIVMGNVDQSDVENYLSYLDPEEQDIFTSVSHELLRCWHYQNYFMMSRPISEVLSNKLFVKMAIKASSPEVIDSWRENLPLLAQQEDVRKEVSKLLAFIERDFAKR
ncbi:MAG: hypothetical protein ACQEP8_03605 [Chlamydiota bacterium]